MIRGTFYFGIINDFIKLILLAWLKRQIGKNSSWLHAEIVMRDRECNYSLTLCAFLIFIQFFRGTGIIAYQTRELREHQSRLHDVNTFQSAYNSFLNFRSKMNFYHAVDIYIYVFCMIWEFSVYFEFIVAVYLSFCWLLYTNISSRVNHDLSTFKSLHQRMVKADCIKLLNTSIPIRT